MKAPPVTRPRGFLMPPTSESPAPHSSASSAPGNTLHACLDTVPAFYTYHRAEPDLRYSDRVIYSPQVPVFRDDTGRLLDRPHHPALITAAAPNLRAVAQNQPHLAATVPATLSRRTIRVLEVAAAHGHRRLVLGVWGCGVFGNDPHLVAQAFATALHRVNRFDHVILAVLDRTHETPTYHAFADAFRSRSGQAANGDRSVR
jgi:uncharacterized protein (TIGR02452 family)